MSQISESASEPAQSHHRFHCTHKKQITSFEFSIDSDWVSVGALPMTVLLQGYHLYSIVSVSALWK